MKQKRFFIPVLALSVVLLSTIIVLAVNRQDQNQQPGKLRIVAAENFWGDIAKQLAGERAEVTSIISSPSVDPHLYESGAKDALAVASADITIANGLGYDDFMNELAAASPNSDRIFIKVSDVLNSATNANPHLWYDVEHISQVADAITAQLIVKDPAGADFYQTKLNDFNSSLQPLLTKIDEIKTTYSQAPVAYTERVAGYLLTETDLSVKTPETFAIALEDGNEPTPADQTAMLDLINNKQIRAFIYNPQAESQVTADLKQKATQNSIPIVETTETMPENQNYQSWMQQVLDSLQKALENTK